MNRGMTKAERLQELQRLYFIRAYSDIEMAERLEVDRSTVYRDRLELEGQVPFIEDEHGRWRIDRTKYISEIRVNLNEALALYLSARRASQQTRIAQPHSASALEKLALALKQPMTDRLVKAAQKILSQNAQPERIKVLEIVAQSWVQGIKVRISYKGLKSKHTHNYVVSPYLIEPSPWNDGIYLIGYSDAHSEIATFKIERIETVVLTNEVFSIPEDFDEQKLLQYAWGIWYGEGEPTTVKLQFAPGTASRRLKESIWHPTQEVKDLENGGCLWSARVAEWQEMLPWIRGWGSDVEVIEPKELRKVMIGETRRIARRYKISTGMEDLSINPLLRFWGKIDPQEMNPDRFHPAIFHMLDTGHVAQALLSTQASPRWRTVLAKVLNTDAGTLENWLPWFISLHDIGKVSVVFQEQNDGQRKRLIEEGYPLGSRRWSNDPYHAIISQVAFVDEVNLPELPYCLKEAFRDALGGHHGQFISPGALREARMKLANEPKEWSGWRNLGADILKEQFLRHPPDHWPEPKNISAAIMDLTGFILLCDWLASDSTWFPTCPDISFEEYAPDSIRKAWTAVETAGFFQPSRSDVYASFTNLFLDRKPRPLQQAADDVPIEKLSQPCLIVIEAPTGEGKTEAALALAHRIAKISGTDELFYALPTTATSNQMFVRLQNYLQNGLDLRTRVKLIHGQAFLYEDDLLIDPTTNGTSQGSTDAMEWFGPKKRSLLAPFGVGTIDQAELAALNVKHVALRLAGLAGKVVILDEVHAYDIYMTTIVERLLEWLSVLGTSVIMLSATLPKNRRLALAQAYGANIDEEDASQNTYPQLSIFSSSGNYSCSPTAYQPDRQIQLNTLHISDHDPEAKAVWLMGQIATGGCACWITNTVDRAQEIFRSLDRLAPPDIDRSLLHARFPLEDRQALEQQITHKYGHGNEGRPLQGIVIGTQVLEQSLDLDFDVMVSDLAPVDLLLQRAGRLHRHQRSRPTALITPNLWINVELDENHELNLGVDQVIYDEFILRQTWQLLECRTVLNLPTDYRILVEAVYSGSQPAPENPLAPAWKKLKEREMDAIQKARTRLLPEPNHEDSFCGPASHITFEESETRASWEVARTRLSEESITVIPLERSGGEAWFYSKGLKVVVKTNVAASRDIQLQLLRRSLHVSNRAVIQALLEEDKTMLFTKSALLKNCIPLWLSDGQTSLHTGKSSIRLVLEDQLGLVITKEKGEVHD